MKIGMYEVHPLCELFPFMEDKTFVALKEDMTAYGQRDTIKLFKGMLLDGKNRMRACIDLKLEPKVEILPDETNIVAYVKSVGLCRRDLRPDQRIAIAKQIHDYENEQNGKKQKIEEIKKDPKKYELFKVKEINEIAKEANSNPKTVEAYLTVEEKAKDNTKAKEQIDKIKDGKTSIKRAMEVVITKTTPKQPKDPKIEDVQKELIEVKTEKISLENRFKRVIEVLKKHNVWDLVKDDLYPIFREIPTLEPTIVELRKAELV